MKRPASIMESTPSSTTNTAQSRTLAAIAVAMTQELVLTPNSRIES